MKYIVIYDACVFYPAPVRDILIELAQPGKELFQAKWTKHIESEWLRNLAANRTDLDLSKLQIVAQKMIDVVPDCIVENYAPLMPALTLPDMNDVHVLAAAIRAKAQAIVTFNLKDFPSETLAQYDIEAIHPDIFLVNQFDLSRAKVLDAVKTIRSRLTRPPKTTTEYLDRLLQNNLTAFVECIKEFDALI